MTSTIFSNLTRPGVFLTEDTAGYRIPEIAPFKTIYMFGSAANGEFDVPTLVTSLTDFTNQFGASPSTPSVRLLFRNDPNAELFFIRVGIAPSFDVTVNTAAEGTESVVINGNTISAVIAATPTPTITSVRNSILSAINLSSESANVEAVPVSTNKVRVFAKNSQATLTVSTPSGNLTVAPTAATTQPRYNDYVYSLENSFDAEEGWAQGYIIAPEAYDSLTEPSERVAVASAFEAHASNKEFDWVHIVDCAQPTYNSITALQNEGLSYTSPLGHIVFYAPYVKDLEGNNVPPSAAVAAVATRRNREQGFQNPPAGVRYALKGVTDVSQRFNNTQQSVVNGSGINLVRYLRNKGVVIWGARTRSSQTEYKFLNGRVILSVLNGTLRDAYTSDIFTIVDGRGVLFSRLTETARSVLRRLWLSNALFGATESEAFEVVCNSTNNPPEELENGNVIIEVYAAVSPTVEKVLIRTYKVPVGQVQSAALLGRSPE